MMRPCHVRVLLPATRCGCEGGCAVNESLASELGGQSWLYAVRESNVSGPGHDRLCASQPGMEPRECGVDSSAT